MLVWGVVASGTGFIHAPLAFYISRFVLGLAEAGFFPGMVIYLTHWFTGQDRAKAVAMFMVAVPVSYVIGSPISALLLTVTWWDLAGWRWVFIVEGIPAIVLGIVNLWYLQDWPKDATWLNEEERRRLQSTIQGASEGKTDRLKAIGYLKHPTVVVMSAVLFLNATGAYGFSLWLPTIISHSTNASDHWSALAAAIPYVVSAVSLVLFGWHSDLRQERRWHTAIPLFLCAFGLSLGAMFSESHVLALVAICLVGSGIYSFLPSFWACVSEVLAGGAAATATGLINAFGSLGGFAGPYLIGYWRLRTHSFKVPLVILAVMMYGAGILIVSINQRKSLVI